MFANNSTNPNVSDAFNLEYMEFRIVKISLYVLIFTLSCIGNSLVAIVITKAKGMWTSANMLILNLALCDLFLPILSIPFDLAFEEVSYIWPFGRGMCKVLWPIQTTLSTSSSLTLAAISLDRFRTLGNPFTRRVSAGKILVFLSAMHVVSISLCIPYFIALDYNVSESSCDETWSSFGYRQAYTVVLFLCQYALPLITMSVAYLLIYRSLRSNTTRLFSTNPETQRRSNRLSTFSRKTTSERQHRPKSKRLSSFSMDEMEFKRKEQNIRLAKMFVFVVVVFAISMFPNQVLWLWVDFGNGAENKHFHYISVVCRLFTYANSVLNPFIYALKSREFRSGFARIGRKTVMQPLRKISNETRRFARKVSKTVLDNPHAVAVPVKYAPSRPLEISDDLSKTVRFEFSDESSNRRQSTPRTPTRKYSVCRPICADSELLPINNGSVHHTWDATERHRDEITVDNFFKFPNNNKLENVKITSDLTIVSEIQRANSRLHKLFQELPETDC